jgi:GNAT superfamily N-acetyltransferase
LRILKLSKEHKRAVFDCGNEELNNYLLTRAAQDIRNNVTTVFVAIDVMETIAGFYTLSATSIYRENFSDIDIQRLPKYRTIPAVLLGRLAVALNYQGSGLGGRLLYDAFQKCSKTEVAWAFLVTNAKNEQARLFYSHFGFFSLQDDINHMCLPRKTIMKAIDS